MSDIFPTRWSEPIYPSLGRKHAGAAGSDEGQAACGGLASASADDLQLNILLCQERMIERSPERFRRAYARLLFHPCAKRHGVEVKTAMHGAELKSGMLLVAEPMGRSANGMLTVAFVQRFAVLYSDMLCIYEEDQFVNYPGAMADIASPYGVYTHAACVAAREAASRLLPLATSLDFVSLCCDG